MVGLGFSDSLLAGLEIAGGSAPAAVNDCGGTLTSVPGTQLIQLADGSLNSNSSCTIVVNVTGNSPGAYQNTIPAGAVITDSGLNVTNTAPATDTLVITASTAASEGGRGSGRANTSPTPPPVTGGFLNPVTGFAPGLITELDSSAHPLYDETNLSIEIPVIKVDTPIVGVESKRGNWDIAWLQDDVGWLNGTAYPTWKGNSVLTAHVVNADGKPGVFYNLKALGAGEYIFVYNGGYRYTYQVLSNTFIQPDDKNIMKHEEKPHLTLITCDTYNEKTGKYLRYVMVRAVLVDVRTIR